MPFFEDEDEDEDEDLDGDNQEERKEGRKEEKDEKDKKKRKEKKGKEIMNFTSKTDADGINAYYTAKINELEVIVRDKEKNVKRLEAQRNELNSRVRALKEELTFLSEPGSSIGEVVKIMSKKKVLVKVNPDGKLIVDVDKKVDISECTPNTRVALQDGSYKIHTTPTARSSA